jgi:hypothetical protein
MAQAKVLGQTSHLKNKKQSVWEKNEFSTYWDG